MDFRFSDDDQAFRRDMQAFLKAEWPGGTGDAPVDNDEEFRAERTFEKKLAQKGWLTMAWPKEYGGQAASHIRQAIMKEECAYYRAPIGGGPGGQATNLVGPAVMVHGTDEQKRRFLPPIAAGDVTGARGSPSRTPAPTSRRWRCAPSATATPTSSTARRRGPQAPPTPTGSTSSRAATPTRPSTRASRTSSST
jgi:hypothetical protein